MPSDLYDAMQVVESQVAAAVFHAEDRRGILKVTVAGDQRIRSVVLDPRWRRALQAQLLDREVAAGYTSARAKAADAVSATYAEAGMDWSLRLDGFVRALEHVAGGQDYLDALRSETVAAYGARRQVVVEFTCAGALHMLHVSTRHASEAAPEQLANDICRTLRSGEDAAERRRTELAGILTGGKTIQEHIQTGVANFRSRLSELAERLP